MLFSRNQRLAAISILIVASVAASAQNEPTQTGSSDKPEQIVQKAIQALGGDRYLNVKTVIGRGNFTDYKDGVSGIPVKFVDYIQYPDKERTEFTGGGAHTIQTNFGGSGWVFDGAAKTLKDQNADQIEEFRLAMRVGVENLLHGWW